jgi:hypothetical protein
MFSLIVRSLPSQDLLPTDASSPTGLSRFSRLDANHRSSRTFSVWHAGLLGVLFCLIQVAASGQNSPVLISPTPGSVLGSSATFTWTAVAGATKYTLYLGTQGAGSTNLYASSTTKATSVVVSGLPQLGVTVYARLSSFKKGVWQYSDYTYTEVSSAPSLSSLTCGSNSITGAGTDACSVTLSGPATGTGLVVSLSSSNSAVTVPASLTVPASATSTAFTAAISACTTAQTATLTASAGGVSRTFAIQLNVVTPTLTINATTINFGNVTLNTTATQSMTLSSTGTAAVTVNSATITGTGFSLSGMTFPATLNPGQNAALNVAFNPTASGVASGTVTISSNSSTNPSMQVTLSGAGVAAAYQVNLAWNAPASSPDPVSGYNIYRAASGTGAYQLINSSPDTQSNYVDSTVKTGQSYDYQVKSVDSSGVESAPSNVSTAVIP